MSSWAERTSYPARGLLYQMFLLTLAAEAMNERERAKLSIVRRTRARTVQFPRRVTFAQGKAWGQNGLRRSISLAAWIHSPAASASQATQSGPAPSWAIARSVPPKTEKPMITLMKTTLVGSTINLTSPQSSRP